MVTNKHNSPDPHSLNNSSVLQFDDQQVAVQRYTHLHTCTHTHTHTHTHTRFWPGFSSLYQSLSREQPQLHTITEDNVCFVWMCVFGILSVCVCVCVCMRACVCVCVCVCVLPFSPSQSSAVFNQLKDNLSPWAPLLPLALALCKCCCACVCVCVCVCVCLLVVTWSWN